MICNICPHDADEHTPNGLCNDGCCKLWQCSGSHPNGGPCGCFAPEFVEAPTMVAEQ